MQEKVGYVYIIMNDCFKENTVKIGKTMKNPEERCLELYSGNTGIPTQYYVYAALRISNYSKVELALHDYFKDRRINNSREWFNVNPDEVLNILNALNYDFTEQTILEPCVGGGHMAQGINQYIENNGQFLVRRIGTDIQDRGFEDEYWQTEYGFDFLADDYPFDSADVIIMNPPYSTLEPFLIRALEIAKDKLIVLCRMQVLEGEGRRL